MFEHPKNSIDSEEFLTYLNLLIQVESIQTDGKTTSALGVRESAYDYFSNLDWDQLKDITLIESFLKVFNVISDKIFNTVDNEQLIWIEVLLGYLDNYSDTKDTLFEKALWRRLLCIYGTDELEVIDERDREFYGDFIQRSFDLINLFNSDSFEEDFVKDVKVILLKSVLGDVPDDWILQQFSDEIISKFISGDIVFEYYESLINRIIDSNMNKFGYLPDKFKGRGNLIEFILTILDEFKNPGYSPELETSLALQIKSTSDTNKYLNLKQLAESYSLSAEDINILRSLFKDIFAENLNDTVNYFKLLFENGDLELYITKGEIVEAIDINIDIIELLDQILSSYLHTESKMYGSSEGINNFIDDLLTDLQIEGEFSKLFMSRSKEEDLVARLSQARTRGKNRRYFPKGLIPSTIRILEEIELEFYESNYFKLIDAIESKDSLFFESKRRDLITLGLEEEDIKILYDIIENILVDDIGKNGYLDFKDYLNKIHPFLLVTYKIMIVNQDLRKILGYWNERISSPYTELSDEQ